MLLQKPSITGQELFHPLQTHQVAEKVNELITSPCEGEHNFFHHTNQQLKHPLAIG